jgi:hypothetical protein
MKNEQTEINNSIQSISIEKRTKEFGYDNDYMNKEKNLEKKEFCEEKINKFKKDNFVISVDYIGGYRNNTIVTYYVGSVKFSPIKQGDSSFRIDINLREDSIKSIIAMCLDGVCELCETQTKAFQSRFINFVGENQESIVKQQETIKKGLISRGFDKVLKLKQ